MTEHTQPSNSGDKGSAHILPIEAPTGELPANGQDVEASIRGALEALAAKPAHDPATGQFTGSALPSSSTLARSAQYWEAIAPAKRTLVAQVHHDRGLNGDTPTTLAGVIDAYAEVSLLRRSLFIRMADLGGPVTTKGKCRALYTSYLSALDREHKLAVTIGLERKPKPAQTLADVLQAHEDADGR